MKNSSIQAGPEFLKSDHMAWFKKSHRECYCAFCKRKRSVYTKRHVTWTDVGSAIVLTFVGSAAIFRTISPKAILVLVAVIMVAEMIVQLRWRMSLPCAHCGFDPLLYNRNPELAAKQVRVVYDRRKERADFLLTGQSLIETQKRIRDSKNSNSKPHSGSTSLELSSNEKVDRNSYLQRT